MDRIPSTKNALLKHIQHTIFQAGIWTAGTEAESVIPSSSPDDFAWTKNDTGPSVPPSVPPPFLHLWYRGYNDANIVDTMASKKGLLKPYLSDHSLRHCFVTAIKHYQKVRFFIS